MIITPQTETSATRLIYPADGDTLTTVQILFQWEPEDQVAGYELKIWHIEETDTTTGPVIDRILIESSQPLVAKNGPLVEESYVLLDYIFLFGQSYGWRCRAVYGEDQPGPWSTKSSFYIAKLPTDRSIRVIESDPFSCQPGLTLLNNRWRSIIWAVDQRGRIVFFQQGGGHWNSRLLPNGHLLYIAAADGRTIYNSRIYEVSLDGKTQYFVSPGGNFHHDVFPMPDGGYLALKRETHRKTTEGSDNNWICDVIVHYDPQGQVLWRWDTFDHVSTLDVNPAHVALSHFSNSFDWTHSNTCFYDPLEQAVYLSIRNISRIVKIDYPSGDVIWSMGARMTSGEADFGGGLFEYQHAPELQADGNLLLFDNRGCSIDPSPSPSRVIEIAFDFARDNPANIVWEFELEHYCPTHGDADRLSNGNILITEDRQPNNQSTIWEVDPDGNKVVSKMELDFFSYRAERIASLYPQAFADDLNAPIIKLISPAANSSINQTLVSYSLNETLLRGTLTFQRTSGSAHPMSPRVVVLYGAELNSGEHADSTLTNSLALVDGAVYSVVLDGSDFAGNKAITVTITGVKYDISPPDIPRDLTATAQDASVFLEWSANTETDISHYLVYRHTDPHPVSADLVQTVLTPGTMWKDTDATDNTAYYYWIAAVDSTGNESIKSNSVYLAPTNFSPDKPTNLTAKQGDRSVLLSWSSNVELDLSHYTVYRAVQPEFSAADSILKINQPDTTCNDTGLIPGTTYWYWLSAVDSTGNTSVPSDSIKVTAVSAPVLSALPDTFFAEDDSLHIPLNYFNPYSDDVDSPDSSLAWEFVPFDNLVVETDSSSITLYAPDNWFGPDTLQVSVMDPVGLADTTTWLIYVTPVNDPPVITGLPDTSFAAGDSLLVYLDDYSIDVDDPDSTLLWTVSGNEMILIGIDHYTRIAVLEGISGWDGSETVFFTVKDTSAAADSDTTIITIKPGSAIVHQSAQVPTEFSLNQNFPNPFNPETIIRYALPVAVRVELDVYDLMGRRVRRLVSGRIEAGYHQVKWDGLDEWRTEVSSGIYFYRIQAVGITAPDKKFRSVRKMVLIK